MNEAVVQRLLRLNRDFYAELAAPFGRSRSAPAAGFAELRRHLPEPCPTFLDVGCGEGRLGRYLWEHQAIGAYTGVDFTPALLEQAAATVPGAFWERDLSQPDCLHGLGTFTGVACLATLQHIPGRERRQALLRALAASLGPAGRLVISTWQFMDSPRQRRKLLPWSEVGLAADEVEPGDYLLSWQRGGFGRRYVRFIDLDELTTLAAAAGLTQCHAFRADGRQNDLNLYVVFAPAGRRAP